MKGNAIFSDDRTYRYVLTRWWGEGDFCFQAEPSRLEDVRVIETVTRRQLSTYEIFDLLDRLPNVKTVSLLVPPRPFTAKDLAYPQSASHYVIPRSEWVKLQAFAKEQLLKGSVAHRDVLAHWLGIASGTPPFGLTVEKSK